MPSSRLAARRQAYLQSIKSKRRFSQTVSPNKPLIKSKQQEQQQSPNALTPTQSARDEKQSSHDAKQTPALINIDTFLPNLLDSRQERNHDDSCSLTDTSLTCCHENNTHDFTSDDIEHSEERAPVSPVSSPHCQQVKEGDDIDSVKVIAAASLDSTIILQHLQYMADPTSQGSVKDDEDAFNDVVPEKAVVESSQMLAMSTLTSEDSVVVTSPAATDLIMDHMQEDFTDPTSPGLVNEMNDRIIDESLDPPATQNLAACNSGLMNYASHTNHDVVEFELLKERAQVKVQTKSATDIQTAYRRYAVHGWYKAFIRAVVTLQSIQRAHPVRVATPHRLALRKYRINTAITIIQTMYRGYYIRCKFDVGDISSQITILQSHVRRHSATAAYRKHRAFIRAVVTLQSIYRAHP
eukprot:scaffold1618_cov27-Cyclotella_meneghiniana.AAC.3